MKNLSKNKGVMISGTLAILALAGVMSAQGCDFQSMVSFDVPRGVQKSIETEPKTSLADADVLLEEWTAFVELNTKQLSKNVEDAQGRLSIIESITSTGIGIASDSASALPGGAILVSGLSMLTGLFLKRPGEGKTVSKEKEKSYNAGIAQGKALVEQLIKKDE